MNNARPQLKRQPFATGAHSYWIQVSHRRSAIEIATEDIRTLHKQRISQWPDNDPISAELETITTNWVLETLLQGAFVREYHLWEKDCKAYFAIMATRNDLPFDANRWKRSPIKIVGEHLDAYQVPAAAPIMADIDKVREKVNVMKHEPGLELDHFITSNDYFNALDAFEQFWEMLMEREIVSYS